MVLDTNLVLSALVFRSGVAASLRLAWQKGACLPLVDTTTVQELIRVLAYPKFRLTPTEQHELLGDYLPYATTVRTPHSLLIVPNCRDPFDLPFLRLAINGKADALVSGGKDLLTLANHFPIPILPLGTFMEKLRHRAK